MLFLFHLEEWELRPPSNYQLSSRQMSHCCPSPVFTVSDKRIAASRLLCSDGFLSGLQAEASEIARPPRAKRS